MNLSLQDRRAESRWRPSSALRDRLVRLGSPAGLPHWPLALVLVDDEEMARLNAAFRRLTGPTDVLSFGYLAEEGDGPPALRAGERFAARDLWRDPIEAQAGAMVGEVVIAPAYVGRGCAERGDALDTEMILLAAHGMLHVLGWEHDGPERVAAMRDAEAELLNRVGCDHPLRGEGTSDRWRPS
jgi:probable rRNA maturation factor